MNAPKDKHESTSLFTRGRYGNNIATYANPEEAIAADPQALFMIRYRGDVGVQGPAVLADANGLHIKWLDILSDGWQESRLYINVSIPIDRIVFQGELSTGNWSDPEWFLIGCTDSRIHMREAMKRASFKRRGLAAKLYLKLVMDASSWEDLNAVIDEWPDGVIELVVFDTPFGSLEHTGRRMIIWESRGF